MLATLFLLVSILIFFAQYFLDGRKIDAFDPKTLFQIYFIIQLPAVLVIGTNFDLPGLHVLSSNTSAHEILSLGLLFLMAHVIIVTSYYATGKNWLMFPVVGTYRWDYRRTKFVVVILFAIGYLSFFYLLHINGGYANFIENRELWRSGGLGGQGWLIFPATTMLSMAASAYVISCQNKFRGKKGVFRLFILMALAIAPASQMGFRGLMLLPLLQILFVYNYKIQHLKLINIAPALLIILMIFTIYGIYRESYSLIKDGFDLGVVIKFASDHPEFIFGVFTRSKGADVVATVVDQMNGFENYKMFMPAVIEAMTIYIPSSIWGDKPIPLSVIFSEQFFGIGGGVSPTIVGEAYWHGAVFGVLLAMTALGFIFRLYNNSVHRVVNKDSSFFIFASIFPSLVMMAEAVQGYLNGISLILIFGLMMIISFSVTLGNNGSLTDRRFNSTQ